MNLEASLCYPRPCVKNQTKRTKAIDWVDGTVGGVLTTQACTPDFLSPEPVFLLIFEKRMKHDGIQLQSQLRAGRDK